ncbi:TetR/AcrR family transcriptional regulator [Amycolatopsis sacchari]|uniref:TetR/AcrR family transcriptional regulator n=1 Tax=Amycolatopsis sacchari TaxID=115433 RepID=UPI003D719EAF
MDSAPRRRLISSAITLLAEEGVEAVTLRRIAREAGVSHGAPLRHFTGRAELLSAVASEGFAELGEVDLPEASALDRLRAACRAYLTFAKRNPAMFELMFRHDLIDTAELDQTVFIRFTKLVEAAQAEGWRTDAEPRMLAASLWAALHGLAELWLWGGLAERDLPGTLELTLNAYLD